MRVPAEYTVPSPETDSPQLPLRNKTAHARFCSRREMTRNHTHTMDQTQASFGWGGGSRKLPEGCSAWNFLKNSWVSSCLGSLGQKSHSFCRKAKGEGVFIEQWVLLLFQYLALSLSLNQSYIWRGLLLGDCQMQICIYNECLCHL